MEALTQCGSFKVRPPQFFDTAAVQTWDLRLLLLSLGPWGPLQPKEQGAVMLCDVCGWLEKLAASI